MEAYHHFFHFFNNRELEELYITISIRAFALSMINIFIPIYLLQLDYSLFQVLLFYLIFRLSHAVCVLPAGKLATKFGFKHLIMFSIPLLIIFYLLLYSLETHSWPIYLLAILNGASNALFWLGYHTDFCKFSQKKKRGREISIVQILRQSFKVIGPLLGGLILVYVGFKALFVCVSVMLLASIIPLLFSKDIHEKTKFSVNFVKGRELKDLFAFLGRGMESNMNLVIWPIVIFFGILNNYASLGLVSSLSLVFSLLCIIMIGKFSDINRKLVLRISSIAVTLVWIMRYFVKTTFQVFMVDSFNGLAGTAAYIPFAALSYDKADKSSIVKFIMFRETFINLGGALLFTILILLNNLSAGFLIGGLSPFLYFLF